MTEATTEPDSGEAVAQEFLTALRDKSFAWVFEAMDGAALPPASHHEALDLALASRKRAADLLVEARLARFTDDARTRIEITNAGRYWAAHGGYFAFLKEEPAPARAGRQRNPETEALRTEYMRLRLGTFWWSFGLSVAGFVMSIISVAIALFLGERLFTR